MKKVTKLQKHYVTFFSPGTLFAETATKEVSRWDINEAKAMAKEISERHGAAPYAFQFYTMERGEDDWEPKETERSHRCFLGGKVMTVEEVEALGDPSNSILIGNMKSNGIDRIITNWDAEKGEAVPGTFKNYRWTQEFKDGDEVVAL
jgi:hypothetical protein